MNNTRRLDPTQVQTNPVEAFSFPAGKKPTLDAYTTINELLDASLIYVVIQYKKLRFGVKHFFPMENNWLDCVVDEPDLADSDQIRIAIKQGLPMIIYVGQRPFTS